MFDLGVNGVFCYVEVVGEGVVVDLCIFVEQIEDLLVDCVEVDFVHCAIFISKL